MLSANITYTPRLSAAEQQLAALPNRLRNLRPLMTRGIAPLAAAMIRRHESTEGSAFGHRWTELARSTIVAKARKGTLGDGILHDTGDLFRAIYRSLTTGASVQAVAGGLRLVLGESALATPLDRMKFRWHMRGTKFMPARQPIPSPLPRSFRDDVRALVHDYIATGRVRGAAGQFVSAGNGA